ncbi:hypothetical protein GYB22_10580 [bacterium]|nr:hypothetical protein [bacterium]
MSLFKHRYFHYILGALILTVGAFYNAFPFFTGDTAVYIASGFENYIPGERPVFYGWFIRFSSLGFSLWFTAFAQSFLLSYLLHRLMAILQPQLNASFRSCIIALIALISGVLWESTKLNPDVFMPILFLALIIFFLGSNNTIQKAVLTGIITLSSVVHLSHLAVLLGFIVIVWIFNLRNFRATSKFKLVNGLAVLSFLMLLASNVILENQWVIAKSNKVFLLGKLNEAGILDKYLDENCPNDEITLCRYKDSLPATAWQFVWEKNGPVMKTGGWEANEEEHKFIVNDILSSPSYYPLLLFKSLQATAVQLLQTNVGDNLFRQEKGSASVEAIGRYYPHEKNQALWNRQFLLELPFMKMSWFYLILLMSAVIWMVFNWNLIKSKPEAYTIICVLLVFLFLNAFFTANLANVSSRLNARMLWLIPAFVGILISNKYRNSLRH